MMKHQFGNEKTELYTRVLAAVIVLLGALCFLRVAGFLTAEAAVRGVAARIGEMTQKARTPGDLNVLLASGKASVEELKKKNLFVVTGPKQHPISEVLGILGSEALINGNWYKVGDSVGDAKIVAIGPTKVKVSWDGQEKDFSPIASAGGERQDGASPKPRPADGPRRAGRDERVAGGAGGGPTPGGQAGPAGLSDEDRARRNQQWKNMTPEERQQAREQTRRRLGSRTR
ncbi:MAG: hypothetical protein ACM3VT_17355 [Solirubrobacterales bacterium]